MLRIKVTDTLLKAHRSILAGRPAARIVQIHQRASYSDDRLVGDYPKYPYEFAQKRDPTAKYDEQQLRRNFNEPLHEDDDMLNMWSPDVHDYVPNSTAFRYLASFFLSIGAFGVFASYFTPDAPAAPRVFPEGLYKELGGVENGSQIVAARVDDGTYYN
ncbi:putative NIAM subunit of mitochondrial NADH:ubiquinone oxidoreductase [Dipodascopsis tothii]|uniref:putative NIAM subunit of mitochondrial NADH:ubiquinone oxidoreductase n=1 Tax=Dipodascopsis tothii TaxID=44089 RepID=UPI0034CE155D